MVEDRDGKLRDWLRAGDPVDSHPGLTEAERVDLRGRVVAAAGNPAPERRWLDLVPVAVAAGLLLVVGSLLPGRERFRGPAPVPAFRLAEDGTPLFFGEPATSRGLHPPEQLRPRWSLQAGGDGPEPDRHIEFTTPGGHRVVWNLNDELRLPDDTGGGSSPSSTRS